ncbi:DUF924 family protein [Pusillimonas sp. MFBS29]|uniref:DUF924 family protein n=1 Tax=Pusillimonas sp. MFBS29 TaxID=2886690 RepID=UPI00351D758A
MAQIQQAQELVDFWRQAGPDAWFTKNPDFDAEFKRRFSSMYQAAARGELDGWLEQPVGSLALVLVLDQFPRNAFRGTPQMFATDAQARQYARHAIAAGHIEQVDPSLSLFFCVPFIHSEDIDDQRYGVELYREFATGNISFAVDHCDIIARFGRFPHRNAILGRQSTAEELQFLGDGGFAG